MGVSITFTGDKALVTKIRGSMLKVNAAITAIFNYEAASAESEMKSNAPWTDRTGNARSGLGASVDVEPFKSYTLNLFDTVPYEFWLEVRWNGRFAAIGPQVPISAENIKSALHDVMAAVAL